MAIKDAVPAVSLLVALASAYFAYSAQQEAAALAREKFEADTTIAMLEKVFSTFVEEGTQRDERIKEISCHFVVQLGLAEQKMKDREPFFVSDFFESLKASGLVDPSCLQKSEELSREEPGATEIAEPVAVAEAAPVQEIGKWHALVASYDRSPRGCEHAREDVAEFHRLLSERTGELPTLPIYVVATRISNNLAVTVDAGDDQALARQASALIRSVSNRSTDRRTGADSFVQGNRGWFIDRDCVAIRVIGE